MWWYLRSYVKLAVLIAVVCIAAAFLPRYLNRITTPDGYEDLKGLPNYSSFWADPAPFPLGGIVAFKIPEQSNQAALGRVVAVAGDTVAYQDHLLLVRGAKVEGFDPKTAPAPAAADMGPVIVPDGHVFVLSDGHAFDSLVRGMIGPDVLLGRIRL